MELNTLTKILFVFVLLLALVMMILKGFDGPWYRYMFRFVLLFSYIIPLSKVGELRRSPKRLSTPSQLIKSKGYLRKYLESLLEHKRAGIMSNNWLVLKALDLADMVDKALESSTWILGRFWRTPEVPTFSVSGPDGE